MMKPETPTITLVEQALCRSGPMNPSEITKEVKRSSRAVRKALRKLETDGRIAWRHDTTDTRYRIYHLMQPVTATDPVEACGKGAHNRTLGDTGDVGT